MSRAPFRNLAACCVVLALESCTSTPAPTGEEIAAAMGLTISPPLTDGIPVRVVDGRTGKPLANALVVSVPEFDYSFSYSGPDLSELDSPSVLREIGSAWLAGSDGTIHLPLAGASREPRALFAWHGKEFGRTSMERDDREEQMIRLQPIAERELAVEVVDAAGTPQPGVPVVLGHCAIVIGSPGACHDVTDQAGRVVFSPLDLERSVHFTCGRQVQVMFGLPCVAHALRPLDAPILEPVRLVLPPCGDLVVDIEDEQGHRLPTERLLRNFALLQLQSNEVGPPRGFERSWPWFRPTSGVDIPCLQNPIHVPRVAIGTQLELSLTSRRRAPGATGPAVGFGESQEMADRVTVHGPTVAGETVHAVMHVADDAGLADRPEESPPSDEGIASGARSPGAAEAPDPADEMSSVAIRVKLDVPIDPCQLRARYRADDSRATGFLDQENSANWVDVQGCATMRYVPAGTWTIAITLLGLTRTQEYVLAEIPHVVVGGRQHLRDPRLLNVDLRGRLRRQRLELVDAMGAPQSGWIHVRHDGSGELEWVQELTGGSGELLTAEADRRPHFVHVDGCRAAPIDLGSTTQRVVVRPGIPVRVALDAKASGSLRPDSMFVGLPELPRGAGEQDERGENDELRTVGVEPGGSALFHVADPGERRVIFLRATTDGAGKPSFDAFASTPRTVTVEDRDDEQTFVVAPDFDAPIHDR